jgi:DNA-binding NarL/FixJ family response regulator
LVDDHAVVRAGIRQVLEKAGASIVVQEAGTAQDALDCVRDATWDAVVMDLSLPDRNGMWLLSAIRRERPSLPVLVLSVHPEEQFAVRVLKAGAAGYVSKAQTPERFIEAVRRILEGGRYISQAVAEQLAMEVAGDIARAPHEALSDREFQVFRMIAEGKRPAEIADELCLSAKTVQTYRARVLSKLGVKGTSELVQYALKHGLLHH